MNLFTVQDDVAEYLQSKSMTIEEAQTFISDRYHKYKTVENSMNERRARFVSFIRLHFILNNLLILDLSPIFQTSIALSNTSNFAVKQRLRARRR